MKKILILCVLLPIVIFAQTKSKSSSNKQNQLITMSYSTSFPEAVKTLEMLSQRFEGRKIMNMSSFSGPIGIPITQLYWKNALELIISFNGMTLEKLPGMYTIKDIHIEDKIEERETISLDPNTKQIRISATLFSADKSFLNDFGIDWSTMANGEVLAYLDAGLISGISFKGASAVTDQLFKTSAVTSIGSGTSAINVSALLNVIEANNVGSVIASPSISVISGSTGAIQVGKDFSIKSVDYSGNTIDKFYKSGVILDVTPTVISDSTQEAIHLKAHIERSDATPSDYSIIVTKSSSDTELLLFDGEEAVIAGLYNTEDALVRKGIPFLKDLPWWVLGIRYLTGYNYVERKEKEIIIILKAEICKPLDERRNSGMLLKDQINRNFEMEKEKSTHFSTIQSYFREEYNKESLDSTQVKNMKFWKRNKKDSSLNEVQGDSLEQSVNPKSIDNGVLSEEIEIIPSIIPENKAPVDSTHTNE